MLANSPKTSAVHDQKVAAFRAEFRTECSKRRFIGPDLHALMSKRAVDSGLTAFDTNPIVLEQMREYIVGGVSSRAYKLYTTFGIEEKAGRKCVLEGIQIRFEKNRSAEESVRLVLVREASSAVTLFGVKRDAFIEVARTIKGAEYAVLLGSK